MRKCNSFFKSLCLITLFVVGLTACSDNGHSGGKIPKDLTTTLERINSNTESVQALASVLSTGGEVADIIKEAGYTTLKFDDETTLNVYGGQYNPNIPSLSIVQQESKYYWTLVYQGEVKELLDKAGKPVEVKPLQTNSGFPEWGIQSINGMESVWTLDIGAGSKALLDGAGKEIVATAYPQFSVFEKFDITNPEFISFNLVGMEEAIELSRKDISFFLTMPEDKLPVLFEYEGTQEVVFSTINLTDIAIKEAPKGWKVELDNAAHKIQITAPSSESDTDETSGAVVLRAQDKNGQEYIREYPVYSLDLRHPDGTFIVVEGNMTSENGTLYYIDPFGRHHNELYEASNNKDELGNVVQDMYIANDKLYIINQNGPQMGGGERLVVCNPRTLKREYSHNLDFVGVDGASVWPQHLVVVGNKVFIQHSSSRMEAESGIRVFNLESGQVASKDIEGTQGEFTKEGALKGRMFLSRGKIYAGLGTAVVIINPETEKVEKTISFKSQVKGIVKASDNNIYVAVAGEFEGNPNFGSNFKTNPSIVCLNHEGEQLWSQELEGIEFPIATWSPSIGLCASFTDDYLYFVSTASFNANDASRFNIKTKELQENYIYVDENLYGYMGVHPTTNALYVGQSSAGFTQSTINVFELGADKPIKIESFNPEKASPAGVDFGYRFTNEFINK